MREEIRAALTESHSSDFDIIRTYIKWLMIRRRVTDRFYFRVHWVRPDPKPFPPERKRFTNTLAEARELLNYLPQWMATEDPLIVNGVLTRLCQKITITPTGEIAIHFQQ